MQTVRAVIELIKLKSVVICVLSVIGGSILAGNRDFLQNFLLSLTFFMIGAGFNGLNDIVDVEADRISRPERPLPSNRLKMDHAVKLTAAFFLLSFLPLILLLRFLSLVTLMLLAVDYVLVIFYSIPPQLKKIMLLSNAVIGAHHTLLPLLAAWSISKPLSSVPINVVLALFFMAWGTHIMEDFEDIEGDKAVGIKTLPIVLGRRGATIVLVAIGLIPLIICLLSIVGSYSPYWLIFLPQQALNVMVALNLLKNIGLQEIMRVHKICEILNVTAGATLIIGYALCV